MDFDVIRPIFGGSLSQSQVDGINIIISAFEQHGDGSHISLAYLLATSKHETANTMQPIHERGMVAYFDKYEPGTKIGKNLGNTLKGDGYKYRGRGYVQLTGRANYVKAGKKLGRDLAVNPDAALEPKVAAFILIRGCIEGWFTGKKLDDYVSFLEMRRVINGLDKAELIAGYAKTFMRALNAAPRHIPAEPFREPEPEDAIAPPPERSNWLMALIQFVLGLFKRRS